MPLTAASAEKLDMKVVQGMCLAESAARASTAGDCVMSVQCAVRADVDCVGKAR